jgi:hypothetical protein
MHRQPTNKRIRELVKYNRVTGVFTWLVKQGRQAAGAQAGSTAGSGGYRRIMLDGYLYLAHRLAVKYVTGRTPRRDVDHKNGRRDDNRYRNLRDAPRSWNNQNRRAANVRNRAGLLGVTYDKRDGRYYARIHVNGTTHSLGGYATARGAHAAYLQSKQLLHPGAL